MNPDLLIDKPSDITITNDMNDIQRLPIINLCKCGVKGTNVCGGCNNAYYCSMECQKLDWEKHKITCPAYKKRLEDKDKKLAEALSRNAHFIDVMAGICNIHHDTTTTKKYDIVCSLVETGYKSWTCKVTKKPGEVLKNTVPGHYSFRIVTDDNRSDLINTEIAINVPVGICKANYKRIFNKLNPSLPLTLFINNTSVTLSDNHNKIILVH